jgi:hypothetical protein
MGAEKGGKSNFTMASRGLNDQIWSFGHTDESRAAAAGAVFVLGSGPAMVSVLRNDRRTAKDSTIGKMVVENREIPMPRALRLRADTESHRNSSE